METKDIILGRHSIKCALENPRRSGLELYGTEEGIAALGNAAKNASVKVLAPHGLQEKAKFLFKEKGFEFQRVTSGVMLVCDSLGFGDIAECYKKIEKGEYKKILCLDQITDVHNAGAILRTACFYGVDAIILPGKKTFAATPSFFKIASGSFEFSSLYPVQNLSKTISKFNELGVQTIALSEHAKEHFEVGDGGQSLCLILGREDEGVSHAVMRNAAYTLSLESQGGIKSLNVSIAAAVSMERCFASK